MLLGRRLLGRGRRGLPLVRGDVRKTVLPDRLAVLHLAAEHLEAREGSLSVDLRQCGAPLQFLTEPLLQIGDALLCGPPRGIRKVLIGDAGLPAALAGRRVGGLLAHGCCSSVVVGEASPVRVTRYHIH